MSTFEHITLGGDMERVSISPGCLFHEVWKKCGTGHFLSDRRLLLWPHHIDSIKWLTAEQAKVVRFEINARRPPWDMPWEIQPGLHPVERAHMAEMYRHRQIKLAKTLALRQARQRAKDEVAALEISRGGYTRASLESIGVAWPPPKGWKKRHITRRVTEELVAINKPTSWDIGISE